MLGDEIRDAREQAEMTQEQLSFAAQIDRTYISLLERGARNPSFTNLCRVAAALNVTPSELLKDISYDA